MANVLVDESTLTNIANSIRAKSGKSDLMIPSAMSEEIDNLPSGGSITNGVEYLEFDSNGELTKAKVYGEHGVNHLLRNQAQLTEVEFPNGITSLGHTSFYACTNLALTELPSSLTSIGHTAFQNCTNLALTELPNGITSIGNLTFSSCTNLALTELPNGITSIGNNAFDECTNLALTKLPSALTDISIYAFDNCRKVTFNELPSGITSIGSYAFNNCRGLTELTFKGKPTSIANNSFNNCTNLLTINVPWAEGEVANAPWGATKATINYNYGQTKSYTINFYNGDTLLQTSTVPYGTMPTYNGDEPTKTSHTFIGWTPTISVVTGDMNYYAQFKSTKSQARALIDRSITEVYNENVTSIKKYMFRYCDKLTTIDLPNVTSIEDYSLSFCSALTTLILRSSVMCTLSSSAFMSTPITSGKGYIYVPSALVDSYKSATNWSTYTNQLRAIEDYPDVCGGGN